MAEKRKKFEVPEQKETGVRINKYLSDAGICSRREADTYIAEGKVTIDGRVAETGSRVFPGQSVTFLGKQVKKQEEQVLIAFYKPVGIVCTTDTREPDNVIDFLNYGKRIYPIGRLDKDSEGLLLLTNDGDIVNKILRAGNHHEKEYQVTVNKPVTPEFLKGMAGGVPILDTVTKPCRIEPTGKCSFTIILTQGLNRQIRRMCEYFGYRVVALKRVRIMHIRLGRLKPGTYRNLTTAELNELREVLKKSSALPAAECRKAERQAALQNRQTESRTGADYGRNKNRAAKERENYRAGRTVK
ncbi:MAG: 23S rRNA pseudouridine(2604) synthase RluF [Lachnospiraceae bacterium]